MEKDSKFQYLGTTGTTLFGPGFGFLECFMKQSMSVLILSLVFTALASSSFGQKGRLLSEKSIVKQEAVVISAAEAYSDGNGVFIRWQTDQETSNLGFYVYRIDGTGKQRIGDNIVAGSAMRYGLQKTIYGEQYSTFDPAGQMTAQYVIESVELNGKRTSTAPIFTKYVADISPLAGATSSDLIKQRIEANPIVSTSDLVYSKELQTAIDDNTQTADPNTQRWVATQPGARIGVRQTGIYRVTRAQLQLAGFNVNGDPALWQLYTDGIEQSIIIGPNADYIDFYGRGIDTVESDTRIYYLVTGPTAGKRMATVGLRPSFSTVKAPNYDQSVSVKERVNYLNQILNGDAENYWGKVIVPPNATTFNFNLTSVDTNAASARVVVRLQGFSTTSHAVNVMLNGQAIGQATGSGTDPYSFDTVVPASALIDGQNSLQMSALGSGDTSFFDSVGVTYKRRYVATQNRLSFTTQNYKGAKIEGFSSANIRIFDITNDGDPMQLNGAVVTPNGSTFDANLPAYRPRAVFAVEDSGILQPFSVSPNNPSTLSTTAHNANLVIISYKDFLTQAHAWADYRRGQGLSVEVVDAEDIYDEFNYGVLSANSVRDFLNYAKNNWQTPPQYVLLIGDGTYDPRNYEGTGYWDLVPVKIVNTVYFETASDDALVDFNDDGLAEIAIGRIPARTSAMVTNALSKTILFEQISITQTLSRGAVFTYDMPLGYDFQAMSGRLRDQLPAGTPNTMIGRGDTGALTMLVNAVNAGPYIVNWSGHGSSGSWAGNAGYFTINTVPQLTNNTQPTVFTMLTCLNGFFQGATNISLAEALLNSQTGGAVAAWASSGDTTPDVQEVMATRFYQQIGLGNIPRMGDLILDAKTVVPGGHDVRLSWVLIGDPMLKVR